MVIQKNNSEFRQYKKVRPSEVDADIAMFQKNEASFHCILILKKKIKRSMGRTKK